MDPTFSKAGDPETLSQPLCVVPHPALTLHEHWKMQFLGTQKSPGDKAQLGDSDHNQIESREHGRTLSSLSLQSAFPAQQHPLLHDSEL